MMQLIPVFILLCLLLPVAQGEEPLYLANNNFSLFMGLPGTFRLIEDISLSRPWVPFPLLGHLDGNGFAIIGLNTRTDENNKPAGLFTSIDGGTVTDLSLHNFTVLTLGNGSPAGALAGVVRNATIINVAATDGMIETTGTSYALGVGRYQESYASGLIGQALDDSRLINLWNSNNVRTRGKRSCAAGNVALLENSHLEGGYNQGQIVTEYDLAHGAGIAARVISSIVADGHNRGPVSSSGTEAYSAGVVALAKKSRVSRTRNEGFSDSAGAFSEASGGLAVVSDSIVEDLWNGGNISTTGQSSFAAGAVSRAVRSAVTKIDNEGSVTTRGRYSHASGGVAHASRNSRVWHIKNTGAVTAHKQQTNSAGCVGSAANSAVWDFENYGNISNFGESIGYAAGGVALAEKSPVSNGSNFGDIFTAGDYSYAAGGVARSYNSEVRELKNSGRVRSEGVFSYAGGVCGRCDSDSVENLNNGLIYTTGNSSFSGGINGYASADVLNNHNNGRVLASGARPGSITGLTGKSEVQVLIADDFKHHLPASDSSTFANLDTADGGVDITASPGGLMQNNYQLSSTAEGSGFFSGGELRTGLLPTGFSPDIWNARPGFLPLLANITLEQAVRLGISCNPGGFACSGCNGIHCSYAGEGVTQYLLFEDDHLHQIVLDRFNLWYWILHDREGNTLYTAPCCRHFIFSGDGVSLQIEAATHDGERLYLVYQEPGLTGSVLAQYVLDTFNQPQLEQSAVLDSGINQVAKDNKRLYLASARDVYSYGPGGGLSVLYSIDQDRISKVQIAGNLIYLLVESDSHWQLHIINEKGELQSILDLAGLSTDQQLAALGVFSGMIYLLVAGQSHIHRLVYTAQGVQVEEASVMLPADVTLANIALVQESNSGTDEKQLTGIAMGQQKNGQPWWESLAFDQEGSASTPDDSRDQALALGLGIGGGVGFLAIATTTTLILVAGRYCYRMKKYFGSFTLISP